MDFKQQVYDVIASFSGQNNVIVINTAYVDMLGDLESALFLSQVIYWADKTKRGDGFFYKTDDEWSQELRISKYAIRKARKKLEDLGILETKVKKANGNPTVHYRLNKERFIEMVISFLRNRKNDHIEIEKTLTEITTEITTEKKEEVEEDARAHSFREIIQFVEQNGFGTVGSYIGEKIVSWVDDTSEELVLEALKIAVENGAKTWKYVETILRDWFEKGYRTVGQVRAAQLAFREQQLKKRSAPSSSGSSGDGRKTRKPVRTEIVPDWLNMDYSQPEDDDFDVEQARRELEERLKKYKDNPDG